MPTRANNELKAFDELLARSGFYKTSSKSAKCYYCGKELYWDATDIPHVEHKRHSSQCPFVVKFREPPCKTTVKDWLELERDRLIFQIQRQCEEQELALSEALLD